MKTNQHLLYENWDFDFPLYLFHPFLETMLLSESMTSRIFLKTYRFWFQKIDGKNVDCHDKEMFGKMHKMTK